MHEFCEMLRLALFVKSLFSPLSGNCLDRSLCGFAHDINDAREGQMDLARIGVLSFPVVEHLPLYARHFQIGKQHAQSRGCLIFNKRV